MRSIPLAMVIVGILSFVAGGLAYRNYMKKEALSEAKKESEELSQTEVMEKTERKPVLTAVKND